MDEDSRYEAVRSRDARFDGEFFFAVETTGIYCRPSCPAVTPKRRNVRFFATAAAAQGSGFRACRRCRPDAAPGSAEWNVRADVVGRAMRLIGDGVVDREGVTGLATRLGYSARQVQRQLTAELGAGPVALARAQRAHTAHVLLQTTELPITEIAFASGFASVRQFNDTIRGVYASTPSELRAAAPKGGRGARRAGTPSAGIPLRLAYRGPYQAGAVFDLLASEAVPGVEEVSGPVGRRTYRRTLRLPHGTAIVAVEERLGGAGRQAAAGRRGGAAVTADPGGYVGRTTASAQVRPVGAADGAGGANPGVPTRGAASEVAARGMDPGVASLAAATDSDPGASALPSAPVAAPGTPGSLAAAGPLTAPDALAAPDAPAATPGAASRPRAAPASATHPPGGWLDARIHLSDPRDLTTAVHRLRRLFDLDADPYAVDERLGADPRLGPMVAVRPGLRSPGAADPEELAVRALVGRAEAGELVRRYGKALDAPCGSLTHLFPEPAVLAEAEPDGPLGALATALADGVVRLDPGADRVHAWDALLGLPGLDEWTVALIRSRALGDPDVAPPGVDAPDSWRPWRSYASRHLRAAGELEY